MTDIQSVTHDLRDSDNVDMLVERAAQADAVLIGEATHGTSEFYRWRAHLTQRLIAEHEFGFVAIEGDWPNCYDANRFVKGIEGAAASGRDVMNTFNRWPSWMWANEETLMFIEWLAGFNEREEPENKAGFYGLDVYSLWESLAAVTNFLKEKAPESVETARLAYRCFEPFLADPESYAHAPAFAPASCEKEIVELLVKLRHLPPRMATASPEERFNAEQNAIVALNAEKYYQTLVGGSAAETWNIRDRHMADTFFRLLALHGRVSGKSKGVIWAHNAHVGDARATDMASAGEINLGQLVREKLGHTNTFIIGFSSHSGSVTASSDWDGPTQAMHLPPAREGSWEETLHQTGPPDKLLLFKGDKGRAGAENKGHRAVGVIYDPRNEWANYVPTVLKYRYDSLLFVDKTRPIHPLNVKEEAAGLEETFPFAV